MFSHVQYMVVASILSFCSPLIAQEGAAFPSVDSALLRQVPQTNEEIEARILLARARLSELEDLKGRQPDGTVAADTENGESLAKAWGRYIDRLQRAAELRASLDTLSTEQHLQSVAEQISQIEQETRELRGAPVPFRADEQQVQGARSKVQKLRTEVNSLGEIQARRSSLRESGFQQHREQIEAELQALQSRREPLQKQVDAIVPSPLEPAAPGKSREELERLNVLIATLELALETLPLEQREAELQYQQEERVLTALRGLLKTLETRAVALTEAGSRSQVEVLELKRAQAASPTEAAMIDLQLFCERVMLRYFEGSRADRKTKGGFSEQALLEVKESVRASKAFWNQTMQTLDYRSGAETSELREEMRRRRNAFAQERERRRIQLNARLNELQTRRTIQDKALLRFKEMAERVSAAADADDAVQRTRADTDIGTLRATFEDTLRNKLRQEDEYVSRLGEAASLLEEHIAFMKAMDHRLQWKRMMSRESGLVGADWAAARAAITSFFAPDKSPAESGQAEIERDPVFQDLFGQVPAASIRPAEIAGRLLANLKKLQMTDWGRAAIGLLIASAVGLFLHRLTRRRGIRLAKEIEESAAGIDADQQSLGSGLSGRLNLMMLNMIGDLALPLLIAGSLLIAIQRFVSDQPVRAILLTVVVPIAGAMTLLRLVHHLFEAESPPHRPLPCSDSVAHHYRWWFSALILFSLFVLPPARILEIAEAAPALHGALMEAYKIGFLLMLFLFLVRRERVLGLGDLPGRHWGLIFTWIAYPLFVVTIGGMLVLEGIGYRALVTFAGEALLETVGALIVIAAIAEYVVDVIDYYSRPVPEVSEPRSLPMHAAHEHAGAEQKPERSHYAIAMLKWLVRLVGLAGLLLLLLPIWGVPVRGEWINWNNIGYGALAVVIALVIDYVASTTLVALRRTGQLPGNTVNIIRRWGRGVLVIMVLLTLTAIAGFKINSIWTFLTAFLAMVAIGFVAVWSILSNILATVVILIWRPFNIGEHVEIRPDGIEGKVVDINFMYTLLRSDEGARIAVPNNLFAQKFIRRCSMRGEPTRTLAEQLESKTALDEETGAPTNEQASSPR